MRLVSGVPTHYHIWGGNLVWVRDFGCWIHSKFAGRAECVFPSEYRSFQDSAFRGGWWQGLAFVGVPHFPVETHIVRRGCGIEGPIVAAEFFEEFKT
jgi:hypothetical protein